MSAVVARRMRHDLRCDFLRCIGSLRTFGHLPTMSALSPLLFVIADLHGNVIERLIRREWGLLV